MNLSKVKKEENKILDKYLKNFVILFRKCDFDNNGILNEEEFKELLKNLKIYDDHLEENANRLLHIIDPQNHKQIIFSDCVSLFKMVNKKFLFFLGNASD